MLSTSPNSVAPAGWPTIFHHETETRLSALLEEVGSPCEPRLRENQPCPIGYMPRHMDFAPAGMEMWGYSADARFVKDATLTFDLAALGERLATGFDADAIATPRLRFSDDRIWTLVKLLVRCGERSRSVGATLWRRADRRDHGAAFRRPTGGRRGRARDWRPGSFGVSSSIWTRTCPSASTSRIWRRWRACRSRISAGRSRPRPAWRPIAGSSTRASGARRPC